MYAVRGEGTAAYINTPYPLSLTVCANPFADIFKILSPACPPERKYNILVGHHRSRPKTPPPQPSLRFVRSSVSGHTAREGGLLHSENIRQTKSYYGTLHLSLSHRHENPSHGCHTSRSLPVNLLLAHKSNSRIVSNATEHQPLGSLSLHDRVLQYREDSYVLAA